MNLNTNIPWAKWVVIYKRNNNIVVLKLTLPTFSLFLFLARHSDKKNVGETYRIILDTVGLQSWAWSASGHKSEHKIYMSYVTMIWPSSDIVVVLGRLVILERLWIKVVTILTLRPFLIFNWFNSTFLRLQYEWILKLLLWPLGSLSLLP